MKSFCRAIALAGLFISQNIFGLNAQPVTPTAETVVGQAVEAAEKLISGLDKSAQEKLLYAFDDQEQRKRWSNLPTGIVERRGIRMGDLNDLQKQAVMDVLKATLSEMGVRQVQENMDADEVLRGDGSGRLNFGKAEYYFSILGKPSKETPWMWQFGGHHLAINATIAKDQITLSPSLTGGQPIDYQWNGKSIRQLAEEEDAAFEFIGSLNGDQLKEAVVGDHFVDLFTGPGRDGVQPKQEGINATNLDEKQRGLLLKLIGYRVGLLNEVHATKVQQEIAKNIEKTWFSWYGPTQAGGAATYRIQGPTVLIEYAPQQLGGQATQHIHAMYRDPTNEYGAKFTK